MNKTLRLDKYLSEMNKGSRREIKESARAGRIKVNGEIVKNTDRKINPDVDKILYDGNPVEFNRYEYYILNKPQGVVSATHDDRDRTVIDLIQEEKRKDLFPVGRLDKDTEGLLIITNDGELSHRLLSPSRHIRKIYYAKIDGRVTEEDIRRCEEGIELKDGTITKPAELRILSSDTISEIELTIYEGKYHQVKRMFAALGKHVIFLKRICMGDIFLDDSLKTGEYRRMTEDELRRLK